MRVFFLRVLFVIIPIVLILQGCSPFRQAQVYQQKIRFGNFDWYVKSDPNPVGPGPNYFSKDNVWVDDQGQLHLAIRKNGDRWTCAEIASEKNFGYGTYTFKLASRVDNIDPQAVVGLFTWHPLSERRHNREIDIEFSKWGKWSGANGFYSVQPAHEPGNQQRFVFQQSGNYTTHIIKWTKRYIRFSSYHGHDENHGSQRLIAEWTFKRLFMPKPRNIEVRINHWLYMGKSPLFNHYQQQIRL